MWLLMPDGALSITVSPKEPGKLQVRARRKEWLDSFRAWCPELGPDIHTTNADYQWRAMAKPEDVARAVAAFTLSIDYSNFKNATMSEKRGLKDSKLRFALHDAYNKIWSTLLHAGDGTSGMQQPYTWKGKYSADKSSAAYRPDDEGTIGICDRLGHWWKGGVGVCIDCDAANPNAPEPGPTSGPGSHPTPAEVKAWWAAHPAKAASVKRRTAPVKSRTTKSTTSAKAKLAAPGEGWDVCPGSGQPALKGTFHMVNGVAKGMCRICTATVPVALDTWDVRSHSASGDGELLEVV